ncbi:MAG: hypothetical protein GEV11_00690 [Streptosporangiales bacterium]|nr:hypothetical protein [Streptosporangiales bacterium]
MGYRSRRMILRQGCDRERAVAAIHALGAAGPVVPTGLRDHFPVPGGVTVVLDRDAASDRLFVQVLGDAEDRVAAVAAELELALDPWSYAMLLDLHDREDAAEARGAALTLLGLGAPPVPDDDFVKRVATGLGDARAAVREGALRAAQRYALAAFAPRLQEMSETDPDPDLRDTAALMLDAYAENGLA